MTTGTLPRRVYDRIPSTPEQIAHRWQASWFLGDNVDPFVVATQRVAQSHASKSVKDWIALAAVKMGVTPPAPPTPTPPSSTGVIAWTDLDPTLDQGQTGHCCGFGTAQWRNSRNSNASSPDPKLANADGHAYYYAMKVLDNEPRQENGSTVHTASEFLLQNGFIKSCAWTASLSEMVACLQKFGSLLVGTDFYNDMETPDANGIIHPTGGVAGGHCYVIDALVPKGDVLPYTQYYADVDYFGILNSWGDWALGEALGYKGHAYIPTAEFEMLAATNGECMVALEV